jgi:hypothetical protein
MRRDPDGFSARPITNSPTAILAAWTALEVLSPFSFRKPEDLAGGDRSLVAPLDGRLLPWESGGYGRKNMKLYYQVVLGSIKFEVAVAKLLERYADRRVERPRARGKAGLAVIIINRDGKPVEEPAVAISSFGWGVLGAPAQSQTGARGWAGDKPNLLNVAVSRAKEALYVVGNRPLWREAGLFRELHARLPEADR